ncbi:unnamed protein product [Diamesa serratosioi]
MFQNYSNNVWLKNYKHPFDKTIDTEQKYSFSRELKSFLNNVTCHCYRHLAQTDRSVAERIMWFIIHSFGASALLFFVVTAYKGFTENPLVTTLHDTIYPVEKIPFPAVSICSNNRISRRAAMDYAQELSFKDPEKRTVEHFLKEILYIGRIYDYGTENEYLVTEFQQFMDSTGGTSSSSNKSSTYSFENIVIRLTPKCENILLKCFFQSMEYPCMSDFQMMETRRTQYGYCCSFNYLKRDDSSKMNVAYHTDVTGPDMGLILLVNGSSDDYFYSIFNSIGFNVQIHNSNEFPDGTSGSAIEKFVNLGDEIFIRVDANSIISENSILRYSAQKRQCLFANEIARYGGKYTRSECIVNCRIRSARALCDCVPFYLPPQNIHSDPPRICTLQHVPCLNKYQNKWSTVISQIIEVDGLEREMEEALLCAECFPSCSDNKYRVSTTSLPLIVSQRKGFGVTNGITNISEVSVIRVFFGRPETWLYKQDVSNYWFEIFSNLGGLCGVVGGYSLISFTEIVYFFVKQIVVVLWRYTRLGKRTTEIVHIYP